MRRPNRIEAKLDALLDGKEVLVRPASLDRFYKTPKSAKDQWFEEGREEILYLIACKIREDQKKKFPQKNPGGLKVKPLGRQKEQRIKKVAKNLH